MGTRNQKIDGRNQRGMTLVFVAASLAVLMSLMAFAIDLAWLYVAHVEAQNVADAAALAAARGIVASGYTTVQGNDFAGLAGSLSTNLAQSEGNAVAAQYTIVGIAPTVTVNAPDYTTPNNPQVTVTVSAAVPTFFIKAVSNSYATVTIRTSASAAVFNPGNAGTGLSVVGTKPWMIPNIDPNHLCVLGASGNCNCTTSRRERAVHQQYNRPNLQPRRHTFCGRWRSRSATQSDRRRSNASRLSREIFTNILRGCWQVEPRPMFRPAGRD